MAIRDGIKNAVSANIARSANRAISSGLKRVAGNLFGVDLVPGRGSAGGPTAPIAKNTKYTTENLSYPLGIDHAASIDQGHYIIFEIMKQQPGKLEAFMKKAEASAKQLAKQKQEEKKEKTRAATEDAGEDIGGNPNRDNADKSKLPKVKTGGPGKRHSSIQMKNQATVRMPVAIALYMPPSVQVSYDVKYGDQEIGVLAETGGAAIKAFMQKQGGIMDKAKAALPVAGKGLAAGAAQFGMSKVAGMVQGADALIAIERGQVITPRMELLFEGVGRRSFSYNFVFIPKSEQEAEVIEEIVQKFKFHMAADFANSWTSGADGVREMTIPDHFNIKYMHMGKENTHLNKISTCALTKMDVDYGAERFTGYADGRPQTTKISLSFTEFNIMSKTHIGEGY